MSIALVKGAQTVPAPLDAVAELSGIPNVTVTHYDVRSSEPAAIRAELNAKGLRDDTGYVGDARTDWQYRWSWPAVAEGGCGTPFASITFSATVTLPRIADPSALMPDVRAAWLRYHNAVVRHEAEHVRIVYAGRERLSQAIKSASCDRANRVAEEVVEQLRRETIDLDTRTDHGRLEGAVFPAPAQVLGLKI